MTQVDVEDYIEAYNKRLIEHYADYSMDRLKDELAAAQEKHRKAAMHYDKTRIRSDKIYVEDATVRIANLKFVINERESGDQS